MVCNELNTVAYFLGGAVFGLIAAIFTYLAWRDYNKNEM